MTSIVQNTQEDFAAHYYSIASLGLLYYDYFLTLDDELRLFWKKSQSFVSILFFIVRYLTLLGNIPVFVETFWTLDARTYAQSLRSIGYRTNNLCAYIQIYHQIFLIFLQLAVGLILSIRIYALCASDKRVLTVLILLHAATVGLAAWAVVPHKVASVSYPTAVPGCGLTVAPENGPRFAASWAGLLAYDTFIFCITVYKAAVQWREDRSRLVVVLLRDGMLYFFILVMVNTSNVVLFVVAEPMLKAMSTLASNCISAILISRLMFNLRKTGETPILEDLGTSDEVGPFAPSPSMCTSYGQPGPYATYDITGAVGRSARNRDEAGIELISWKNNRTSHEIKLP